MILFTSKLMQYKSALTVLFFAIASTGCAIDLSTNSTKLSECFMAKRGTLNSVRDFVFENLRPRARNLFYLDESLSCEDLSVVKDAAPSVHLFKQARYGIENIGEYRPLDLTKYEPYSTALGLKQVEQRRLPPRESTSGHKSEYLIAVSPWGTRGWRISSNTEFSVLQEYGLTRDGKITYYERMRFKKQNGKWLFDGFEAVENTPEVSK